MTPETELLSALAESADRLKDSQAVYIRACRVAALDAYRACWRQPGDNKLFASACEMLKRLFSALWHDPRHPDPALLERPKGKPCPRLPSADNLRKDLDRLKSFCIVNDSGAGEVVLMHVLLLLHRNLCKPQATPHDPAMATAIGNVIELQPPACPDDNLAPFSFELKVRHHAVRVLYAMESLGCLSDVLTGKPDREERGEITNVFTNELCPSAAAYIPEHLRPEFDVLDTAFGLRAHAFADGSADRRGDDRTPWDLFRLLCRRLKEFDLSKDHNARRKRLLKLSVTAIVRFMAYMKPSLGRAMYRFLRRGGAVGRVRHEQMFLVLRNNTTRLRFLNFLHAHGQLTPERLAQRFQKHFGAAKLRFVSEQAGFELISPEGDDADSRTYSVSAERL